MLKQLELVGFKSFADRTRFGFPAGITCVVGPNGSGKSNVVDAIKWVLGEQSVKTLRGKDATDVIFNGSGSRKPMNSAEVTLTFDNSKGLFAGMSNADVAITRRIYRSGESEYLLNGEPTRLRDIREILSGTGMGTQAYCVIEQGRVDALLAASPKDRRALFEEAAGISRFRVKKLEAIRRLERVDQNLLRLSDIVEQVRDRLETVRHQAGKAKQFRDLSQRWEALRLCASWFDRSRLVETLSKYEEELRSVTEARALLVSESDAAEVRLTELDVEIRAAQTAVRDAEAEAATNRERIAGTESMIEHEQARLRELGSQVQRFQSQRLELSQRREELLGQYATLESEVASAERRRAAAVARLAEQEAKESQFGSEIQSITEQQRQQKTVLRQQMQAVSRLDNRIGSLEGKVESTVGVCERLENQRQESEALGGSLAEEKRRLDEEKGRLEHAATAKNADWAAVLAQIEALRTQRMERDSALNAERQKRTAVAERIAVLEELEKRHEGLSPGVREVLQLAATPQNGPFTQVRGLVADLFRVSVESAALVETALGERAQHVVAMAGEELLETLVNDPFRFAGRVGFLWLDDGVRHPRRAGRESQLRSPRDLRPPLPPLPVEHMGPSLMPVVDDLTGLPGVVDRIDRLIDTDEEYRPLAQRLLSRTWIVESLEDAVDLAPDHPDCKFVTFTGEVLDADGSVTVGPRNVSSGLISRRSELRELRIQLASIESNISQIEVVIAQFDREIAVHEQRGKELANVHQAAMEALSQHAHRITAAEERTRQWERQLKTIDRDLNRARQERDTTQQTLEEARQQRLTFDVELERLENLVAQLSGALETLELRHERLAEETTEVRIEVAKADEANRNLDSRRLQIDETVTAHERTIAACVEQLLLYRQRIAQSERTILQAGSELATVYLMREKTSVRAEKLIREHDQRLAQRAELAGSAHKYRAKLRRLEEKMRQNELLVEQTRMNLATLEQRFREEFGRELSEIQPEELHQLRLDELEKLEREEAEAQRLAAQRRKDAEQLAESGELLDENGASVDFSDPDVGSLPIEEAIDAEETAKQIALRREAMQTEIESLRQQLQSLGSVNQEALAELDALEKRHAYLDGEYRDLTDAKTQLEKILERINADSRRIFLETVETVRGHFQKLYRDLFGGGHADILLEADVDPLESGIDIVARPPGKQLQNMTLLSGGEKTMTCVALLLAIFRSRPGPFCILDEVDAALDESNVGLFTEVLHEFLAWTQFIMISHSKKTMSAASTLYGITMQEPGISRQVSVKFEDVSDQGDILTAA
ncbi:MAG: AAA family ATPase [Thermoguttaceae bacterium]|nr:AAA family ATPase [Thermoguttaceae bacterium]